MSAHGRKFLVAVAVLFITFVLSIAIAGETTDSTVPISMDGRQDAGAYAPIHLNGELRETKTIEPIEPAPVIDRNDPASNIKWIWESGIETGDDQEKERTWTDKSEAQPTKWNYDGRDKGFKSCGWINDTGVTNSIKIWTVQVTVSGDTIMVYPQQVFQVGYYKVYAQILEGSPYASTGYYDVLLAEFEIVKSQPKEGDLIIKDHDGGDLFKKTVEYDSQQHLVEAAWNPSIVGDVPTIRDLTYYRLNDEGDEIRIDTSAGEPRGAGTYIIRANTNTGTGFIGVTGLKVGTLEITPAELVLSSDSKLSISQDYDAGQHDVEIRIKGKGNDQLHLDFEFTPQKMNNGELSPAFGGVLTAGSSGTFDFSFRDVKQSGIWSWEATEQSGNYKRLTADTEDWIKVSISPRTLDLDDLGVEWHEGYTEDDAGKIHYTYDGGSKQPKVYWKDSVTSEEKDQIKVVYIKDGVRSENPPNGGGEYEVYAVFNKNDPNYVIGGGQANEIRLGTIVIDPRNLNVDTDLRITWDSDRTSKDSTPDYGYDGTGKGPGISWVEPLEGPFDIVYFDEDGDPVDGKPAQPGEYSVYVKIDSSNKNFNPVDAPSDAGFIGKMTITGEGDSSIGDIIVQLDEDDDGERDGDDRKYYGGWSDGGSDGESSGESGNGTHESPTVQIRGYEAGPEEELPEAAKTMIIETDVDPDDIPYWIIPTVWIDVPTGKKPVIKLYDEDGNRRDDPEILGYTSDSVTFITYESDYTYLKMGISFIPLFIPTDDWSSTDSEIPGATGSMVFDESNQILGVSKTTVCIVAGVIVAILAILLVTSRKKSDQQQQS